MKGIKHLLSVVALMGMTLGAAQAADGDEREAYPYNFLGVKGGVQLVPTDYDHSKLLTPIGGVQFGRYFVPEVGLRLDVQGWQTRAGLNSLNDTYDWKYITGDIDVLFNLSNIFSQKKDHRWNWILVAGVGLAYAWDNDDLHGYVNKGLVKDKNVEAWKDHRYSHNFRAGLMLDYGISRHWSVNLEVDANNLSDRFNSKLNDHCDWQPTAMLGINFRWGHPKKVVKLAWVSSADSAEEAPTVESTNEAEAAPAPTTVAPPKPAPAPVAKEAKLDFFFERGKSVLTSTEKAKLQQLPAWAKEAKIVVSVKGYADKNTGSASLNAKLAKKRAQLVADELVKCGIPKEVIEVNSYGDTVQPFSTNDENRVVRVEIKEKL